MNRQDLANRIKHLVKEEVSTVLSERSYQYGGILDPENFDPVDPEVHIVGFGAMSRSSLRTEISTRIEGALKTAKDAAAGVFEDKGVLMLQINAEIEIANQLESLRTKGGRRAQPIPQQF